MGIWKHVDHITGDESTLGIKKYFCPFCGTFLDTLGVKKGVIHQEPAIAMVKVCQKCGWWNIFSEYEGHWRYPGINADLYNVEIRYAYGTLRNLKLDNRYSPLQEIQRYLLADNKSLHSIDPRLLEEIIDDVFKKLGYPTKLTPKVRDGGIDIYLYPNSPEDLWGIEVKRYKNKVGIHLIRAFLTALKMKDVTKGYFFATSGLTSGAKNLILEAPTKGLAKVDIIDADWLFDNLNIIQAPAYSNISELEKPVQNMLENLSSIPVVDKYETHEDDPPNSPFW